MVVATTEETEDWLHKVGDLAFGGPHDDWAGYGEGEVAEKYAVLFGVKFNPFHLGPGSPEGGEFTDAGDSGGGGGAGATPGDTTPSGGQDARERTQVGAQYDKAMSALPKGLLGASSGKLAEKLAGMSDGKLSKGDAVQFINAWKEQNPDEQDVYSTALQQALAERFSVPMNGARTLSSVDDYNYDDAGKARVLAAARAFVDAQYQNTQDTLKAMGMDSVPIVRGVAYREGDVPSELLSADGYVTEAAVKASPLSSWTWKDDAAAGFATDKWGLAKTEGAGVGFVLSARVPRSRIFSTGFTGLGMGREGEFTVIGGSLRVGVSPAKTGSDGRTSTDIPAAIYAMHKAAKAKTVPNPDIDPHNQTWLAQTGRARQEKAVRGKFNQNHDELGRFATSDGGSSSDVKGSTDITDPTRESQAASVIGYATDAAKVLNEDLSDYYHEDGNYESAVDALNQMGDPYTISWHVAERSGGQVKRGQALDFITNWNEDVKNSSSIVLTQAARELWNLPASDVQLAREATLLEDTSAPPPSTEDAKLFLQAQYEYTQKTLADIGYKPGDTIDIYRAFSKPTALPDVGDHWSDQTLQTRPLTSWTADIKNANAFGFAGGRRYIAHAKVPVSDIVSTAYTGLGVMSETEYILRGGSYRARIIHAPTVDAPNVISKYNQNHDERGRFSSSIGSASPSSTGQGEMTYEDRIRRAQALGGQSPSLSDDDAERFIAAWNTDPGSRGAAALTEAVRQKFSLESTPLHNERMADNRLTPGATSVTRVARPFIDAQYEAAQRLYASEGLKPDDTIDLYRGIGRETPIGEAGSAARSDIPVVSQPMSAWSSDPLVAQTFAAWPGYNFGYTVHAKVPVKDVISYPGIGLGQGRWQEYLVKGGSRMASVQQYAARGDGKGYAAKFNQNHEPGGSPIGGEFAPAISTPGGVADMSAGWQGRAATRLAAIGITKEDMVTNMEEDFQYAQPSDQRWYNRAYAIGQGFTQKYGVTDEQAYGVLAAISPLRLWSGAENGNVEGAESIISAITTDAPFTVTARGAAKVAGYTEGQVLRPSDVSSTEDLVALDADLPTNMSGPDPIEKAVNILRGADPDSELGGPKVRSFYNNMANPDANGNDVTLDAFMFRSACDDMTLNLRAPGDKDLSPMTPATFAALTNAAGKSQGYGALSGFMMSSPAEKSARVGLYPAFADAVRTAAATHGIAPSQYQAMVWQGLHRRYGLPT